MLGYNQIASRYGYVNLFSCSGAINQSFVAILDKFLLGDLKPCEATFGDNRKIIEFLEYAQIVGMVILLALMLYANGNDWLGYGKGK